MKTRTYAVILWLYVNTHVRGTKHLQHLFCLQLHSLLLNYRKIPNISPGVYIFQRPFLRGIFLEGLILGGVYLWREICVSKSIGQFPSTSSRGAYIWRGDLMEGFLRYEFGGLIFGGTYTWRGLFSEFYVN